ncbi:hypothetical protein E4U42_003886 [Claviceps africana]|uniref:Uncharacterized protein n=1 Tax=Claviceps africana TaxID=83212 RepID=A0A8K0NGI4_9HYPO|nr:hypothetical protein E4U42_003886 [Claviceps africana]
MIKVADDTTETESYNMKNLGVMNANGATRSPMPWEHHYVLPWPQIDQDRGAAHRFQRLKLGSQSPG